MKIKQLFTVFAMLMIAQIAIAQQFIYGDQNKNNASLISNNEIMHPATKTYYVVDEAFPNTFTTGNNTLIVCQLVPGSDTNIICSTSKPENGWGTMVNQENDKFTYQEKLYSDGTDIYSIAFTDPNNGWAVGVMESLSAQSGVVFHTKDGGKSWRLQYLGGTGISLNSVGFIDSKKGRAYGERTVGNTTFEICLTTDDGGETWTEQSLAQLDGKLKSSQLY